MSGPIYCTGGCDACRDYAHELGVPLVVPSQLAIDVERLARALVAMTLISKYRMIVPDGSVAAVPAPGYRDVATAVAREYDRLGKP